MEGCVVMGEGVVLFVWMKLRILSWNVRGVNYCDKRKVIKALIRNERVGLVCLKEINVKEMSSSLVCPSKTIFFIHIVTCTLNLP